ncbi:TPA: lipopolysaccharide biosynthesis protein [Photobacterium damselae]
MKYKKIFHKNSKVIYYGLALAIPQIFSFLTVLMLTMNLSPSIYAKVAIFESILFFIQIFVSLSIERGASRFFIDHDGREIISISFLVVILNAVVLYIIILVIDYYYGVISFFKVDFFDFSMLFVAVIGYSLTIIALIKFQFEEQPKKYLLLSLCKTLVILVVVLLSIFLFNQKERSYVIGNFVSALLLIIVTAVIIRPKFIDLKNTKLVKELILYSLPFIPMLLSAWIMSWSNRFFMQSSVEDISLGIYSAIYQYCMMYFLVTQAMTVYFRPILYKNLRDRKYCIINKYFKNIILLYSTVTIISYILIPLLISEINDYDFLTVLNYSSVIISVNYISSLMGISTNLIFSFYKKNIAQMIIFIFVASISIILNYLLIPRLHMKGVLLSLFISITVLFIIHMLYVIKLKLPLKIKYKEISPYFVITLSFLLMVRYFI